MNHQRFSVIPSEGGAIYGRIRVNNKAKRFILRLDETRTGFVVTIPHVSMEARGKRFAEDRVDWITQQLRKQPIVTPFDPGTRIPFRGAEHTLIHQAGRGTTQVETLDDSAVIKSPGAIETFGDRVTRFLKRSAKNDLERCVETHCERLKVNATRISIRDTRSRWGSCSAKGHLSFSWRLVCAPPHVLDYVAAHEVSHLIEMNHSPAFWARVTETFGPYDQARGWLRKHGASLHALGKSGLDG